MKVFEEDGVVDYLKQRNIAKQYLKAKKYRALGYFENEMTFIVVEISDHQ